LNNFQLATTSVQLSLLRVPRVVVVHTFDCIQVFKYSRQGSFKKNRSIWKIITATVVQAEDKQPRGLVGWNQIKWILLFMSYLEVSTRVPLFYFSCIITFGSINTCAVILLSMSHLEVSTRVPLFYFSCIITFGSINTCAVILLFMYHNIWKYQHGCRYFTFHATFIWIKSIE
jgi:hypothetical protein